MSVFIKIKKLPYLMNKLIHERQKQNKKRVTKTYRFYNKALIARFKKNAPEKGTPFLKPV
jgi:hypothetical protein